MKGKTKGKMKGHEKGQGNGQDSGRRGWSKDFSAVLGLIAAAVAAGAGAAGCGSQGDDRPATWEYISTAIVQPNCATANCHSNLAQSSGVELDRINRGYDALISRFFVIPGHPEDSSLMLLLNGQGSRRMPPDFPLAQQDIDLIAQWITNGAAR
jgi:hypothetical protein